MDIERASVPIKNMSYLYARDPSILAWGCSAVNKQCRKNLQAELGEKTSVQSEDTDTVQTYLRLKKPEVDQNLYQILNDNTLICNVPDGSHAIRNLKDGSSITKKYTFTKIFNENSCQRELFHEVVKPKLLQFINGSNYNLLTYGASGSGKTYTIVGTAEEPGLIPRSLEYLFRSLPRLPELPRITLNSNDTVSRASDKTYRAGQQLRDSILHSCNASTDDKQHMRTYRAMQQRLSCDPVAIIDEVPDISLGVWVSYAEIYNEYIYDLLTMPEPHLSKRREKLALGNCNGQIYIKNLTMVPVSSGLEAYQVLQYGLRNLNFASTNINSRSSRSHCIFTIKFVQMSTSNKEYNINYFNFCDLAGSERVKKTLNVGERLKESNNINTSLLVLGRCISAIRESQRLGDNRLIPFRESKLTTFFKRALSGLEDISMIVNINPSREMFDESHHVLNFSAIAKDIIIEQPKIDNRKRTSRFSNFMQGRSTSFQQIAESEEEDIEDLRRVNIELMMENERLRQEMIENEVMARKEVIQSYKKLMAQNEQDFHKQIDGYRKKIRDYEMRMNTKAEEIINLDSSSEEDDEKENFKEQLERKYKEIDELKCKDLVLEKELAKANNKISELTETLKDAQILYEECKRNEEKLMVENMKLQDRLTESETLLMAKMTCTEASSAEELRLHDDDYVLQNEFYCAQTNDNVINKSVHIKTEPCE